MRYPGGKNSGGTWRRIVNQIPPHDVLIETHLGSGALLRNIRPAKATYGIDVDQRSIDLVQPQAPGGTVFRRMDGAKFLARFAPELARSGRRLFVYCDPPYLDSTRRRPGRRYYRHEMTEADHRRLLEVVLGLPRGIMVMVSGYRSALYDRMLKGWRTDAFRVQTRGGPAVEVLWMNYPPPTELHDDRWIGGDWRRRLDFHRLVKRWTRRFEALDPIKRAAVLAALVAANGKSAAGSRRQSRSTPGSPTAAVPPGGSAAARGGRRMRA